MATNESIQSVLDRSLDIVKKKLKITEHKFVYGDVKKTLNLQEIKIQIADTKARSNRIALQNALHAQLLLTGHNVEIKENSAEAIKPIEITDHQGRLQGFRIFFKPLGRATPVTEFSESLVAYACSIYQNPQISGDIEIGDLVEKNLPASKNVFAENKGVKLTLSNCVGALNEEWWQSSVAIANALMGSSHVDSSITYNFHRGDAFMNNLYTAAKKILKAGDASGRFGSMDMNKWNPSDIWLSSNKITWKTIEQEVNKMKGGIQEFNSMLTRLRNEKKLIGLSLKKTEGATTTISLIKNESKTLAEKDIDLKYVGATESKGKIQKSIVLQFKLNGNLGDMQFRNFDSSPKKNGFQGNITGLQGDSAAAVHGKVGVWRIFMNESGAPKKFLSKYGMYIEGKNLPIVNTKFEKAMKDDSWTEEMTLFKVLFNKINGKSHNNEWFIKEWSSARGYDFCSNLLALQVTEMVENQHMMSVKVQNEFMSGIILYAMSQIPGISSTFLKNK